MKKAIIFFLFTILGISFLTAQKVASFSYGTMGSEDYEEFSFWIKANKRAEINYYYGSESKEASLKFIGKDILNGENCFKVQFKNNYTLYVIIKDDQLKVSDLSGKYSKYFDWKYEGPVDGIGTFCEPCAADSKEAIRLLKLYYFK